LGQSPEKSDKSDSRQEKASEKLSEKARVLSPYSRKSDAGGDDGLDGIGDYEKVAAYQNN
jgi:hypothetical protein